MTEPAPIAAIIALGITQIIGYGTLYYSFSILAPDMSRDLGWSSEAVFGALSAALLIGGLMAPALGKWIDRFGAGRIMTAGSAIAAAALVACALAPGRISFVAALIGIEAASNLVQYGAAFALLVQIRPQAAQRSITYLTLIGGFASTIFWPITTMLHAEMSWQQVYLVFAGLNLIICLPIHAVLSRQMRRNRERSGKASPARRVEGALAASARRMGFVLMALSFSLQSLVKLGHPRSHGAAAFRPRARRDSGAGRDVLRPLAGAQQVDEHALRREPAAAQACHHRGHAYVGSGIPARSRPRLPLPAPSHSQSSSAWETAFSASSRERFRCCFSEATAMERCRAG